MKTPTIAQLGKRARKIGAEAARMTDDDGEKIAIWTGAETVWESHTAEVRLGAPCFPSYDVAKRMAWAILGVLMGEKGDAE